MKQLFLCILSISILQNTFAQITIDQTDLPSASDKILRSTAAVGTVDYTLTGSNYNWDFSALTSTTNDTLDYFNITSAPIFAQFVFNGFNQNAKSQMFNNSKNPLNFPQLLSTFFSVDSSYSFIKKNATRFAKTGFSLRLNGIDLPLAYDSNDVVYKLPMTFGNTDSSNSEFEIDIPLLDFLYYQQKQKRVNNVDGFGKLKLPNFATDFDVLRIKSELYIVDTIRIDTGFIQQGFKIPRPKQIEYKWLAKGQKAPVLEVVGTEIGGVFTASSIKYLEGVKLIPAAVQHIAKANFVMYPNPAKNEVVLTELQNATIQITNAFGQIMFTKNNLNNRYVIDVAAWPSGIYNATCMMQNKQNTAQKLQIIK